ncbi:class I SAM-dependent methyltransferase [Flavobacterium sp.]|uniref:class I SAM-dependent methyltransferase n=1 Tax=Flavobacterium sp. TaxID=239 RepID=UPI0025B81994|nr:class I SAM-dependent methyltransferase [Flavobacterium sp.]
MAIKDIENIESRKLRGGYYTPQAIADFICRWAITKPSQTVLEPSCGDGNFIEASIKRFIELGVPQKNLFGLIKGIELVKKESEKSKQRAANYGLNSTTIVNSDFFSYISNGNPRYDIVIGNPPFIRYQNFPEEHRQRAFEMMNEIGLKPNKLTNIWIPFLVISASLLNKNGKLGMVIPAELFQVKYAAETRIFLAKFFPRITIVTFKKLVFSDIQQEVVLLLCEKDVQSNKGIRVVELSTLKELESLNISKVQKSDVKTLEHNSEKWTKYFLDENEIKLLREIKEDKRIKPCSSIMSVDVGIVTGKNDFFMMNKETVAKWKLKAYTQKVVSKSAHFKGIQFKDEDFEDNSDAQHSGYLFLPPNKDFEDLPQACKNYIKYGEEQDFHVGYKCRIRKRWYITPSLWCPDAFALRQVGDYPKIIVNKTEASSTDTIHRVRLTTKVKPEIVALSFLNSLSFAFSEITGRSYGGGVLTFEPTEIEEIPLPLLENTRIDLNKIDNLIRQRRIEEVLDIVDQELLIKQLKFTKTDVEALRAIWRKLSSRRLNRRK